MVTSIELRPCMILETVELLRAFVNEIPAQELTSDGVYCIPNWDVQQIMNDCCAGLSRQDPMLQHYFAQVPVQDESGTHTCLARNIVYNTLDFSCRTVEESAQSLRRGWRELKNSGQRPQGISDFSMGYGNPQDPGYAPLARDIDRLLVPPDYRQKLLEAFAGFDDTVEELVGLLAPIARKLEPHLTPWVEQAAPLVKLWEDYLSQPDLPERLQKRWQLGVENDYHTIHMCLRYLDASHSAGQMMEENCTVTFHMGVGRPVFPEEKQELGAWEYKALRLLGSPARIRMLQATMDKPMSTREIAQELGMHLGAAGRDVSSLFDARLLIVEHSGGKSRYRANTASLETIGKHLISLKAK